METLIPVFVMVVAVGVLLGFAFWIWVLIDCVTKEADSGNNKIVWILIIVFAHVIGALIYYFVRRPQRYVELHR